MSVKIIETLIRCYEDGVMSNISAVASGNGSRPNDDVLTVTGRPPISFADFAALAAHAWKK